MCESRVGPYGFARMPTHTGWSPRAVRPVPLHESSDAVGHRGPRLVPQQALRFGNIRASDRDVTRLVRRPLDPRTFAERVLNKRDECPQRCCLRTPPG